MIKVESNQTEDGVHLDITMDGKSLDLLIEASGVLWRLMEICKDADTDHVCPERTLASVVGIAVDKLVDERKGFDKEKFLRKLVDLWSMQGGKANETDDADAQ